MREISSQVSRAGLFTEKLQLLKKKKKKKKSFKVEGIRRRLNAKSVGKS